MSQADTAPQHAFTCPEHGKFCDGDSCCCQQWHIPSHPIRVQTQLTFDALREANVQRMLQTFHPTDDWSPERWGLAFVGEAGETLEAVLKMLTSATLMANSLKKVIRGDGDVEQVKREVADTILYGDLLLRSVGADTGQAVRETFNAKSREIGSEVFL